MAAPAGSGIIASEMGPRLWGPNLALKLLPPLLLLRPGCTNELKLVKGFEWTPLESNVQTTSSLV
jgi:hypothetical protein